MSHLTFYEQQNGIYFPSFIVFYFYFTWRLAIVLIHFFTKFDYLLYLKINYDYGGLLFLSKYIYISISRDK